MPFPYATILCLTATKQMVPGAARILNLKLFAPIIEQDRVKLPQISGSYHKGVPMPLTNTTVLNAQVILHRPPNWMLITLMETTVITIQVILKFCVRCVINR